MLTRLQIIRDFTECWYDDI